MEEKKISDPEGNDSHHSYQIHSTSYPFLQNSLQSFSPDFQQIENLLGSDTPELKPPTVTSISPQWTFINLRTTLNFQTTKKLHSFLLIYLKWWTYLNIVIKNLFLIYRWLNPKTDEHFAVNEKKPEQKNLDHNLKPIIERFPHLEGINSPDFDLDDISLESNFFLIKCGNDDNIHKVLIWIPLR